MHPLYATSLNHVIAKPATYFSNSWYNFHQFPHPNIGRPRENSECVGGQFTTSELSKYFVFDKFSRFCQFEHWWSWNQWNALKKRVFRHHGWGWRAVGRTNQCSSRGEGHGPLFYYTVERCRCLRGGGSLRHGKGSCGDVMIVTLHLWGTFWMWNDSHWITSKHTHFLQITNSMGVLFHKMQFHKLVLFHLYWRTKWLYKQKGSAESAMHPHLNHQLSSSSWLNWVHGRPFICVYIYIHIYI